jgi:hypothetical protein
MYLGTTKAPDEVPKPPGRDKLYPWDHDLAKYDSDITYRSFRFIFPISGWRRHKEIRIAVSLPTHSMPSVMTCVYGSERFVFGTGGRIRQSPKKIDFLSLELKRAF